MLNAVLCGKAKTAFSILYELAIARIAKTGTLFYFQMGKLRHLMTLPFNIKSVLAHPRADVKLGQPPVPLSGGLVSPCRRCV